MPAYKTKMSQVIREEVEKVKGIALPVHAGRFERATVRKVKCSRLHPNPNDEFSFPEIGPNEEIVSNYEKEFRILMDDPRARMYQKITASDPLIVQKIHPDGYMILNGHHRWIAAIRSGVARLPVRIVNLTQEKDIRKMLESSRHDRRITLDLEEIVLSADKNDQMEKPLGFPFGRVYHERIRLGIPALFSFCITDGYDVWLYSAGYESMDYVRELMKLYRAPVTGVITGTARKLPKDSKAREKISELMAAKYTRTVHMDNNMVLCIDGQTGKYREFPLKGTGVWAAEIIEIMGALNKDE